MFHLDKLPTFVYNYVELMSSDHVIHKADVVGVDDGQRPYMLFFCLSWFQKKEKKREPRPVYDDKLEDDEKDKDVLDAVALPPRDQHEDIELKTMISQSQLEAGPSRLVEVALPQETETAPIKPGWIT